MRRNIKLVLQYDGTDFCGWELQPGRRSVRREIEQALFRLFREKSKLTAASRTDSGVHALGQVVNFKLQHPIPISKVAAALNSLLPDDLRVMKAEAVRSFHARYDVKNKEYEYLIFNGEILPPLYRQIVWHVKPMLNIAAMRKAAKFLVGKHDFQSFCASHSDDKNYVRILHKLGIRPASPAKRGEHSALGIWKGSPLRVISCQLVGNGFLYKMVRNIVGTLVEVGLGRRKPSDLRGILEAKDRKQAGRTAPAPGLCLVRVNY